MSLKGHKRGCRCVGCSPATRKRGMTALRRSGGKRHKNVSLKGRTMAEAIKAGNFFELTGPHGFNYSPPAATRPGEVLIWARKLWEKAGIAKKRAGLYQIWRIVSGPIGARTVTPVQSWYFDGAKWKKSRRVKNPLNRKEAAKLARLARGERVASRVSIKRKMPAAAQYHAGRSDAMAETLHRFGASKRIRQVGATIRHRPNPPARYVGSNVVLNGKGLGLTSRIVAGPGDHKVTVVAGKFARRFAPGDTVRRAEYDNRAKAIRAYGKPGRFFHDFKGGVKVVSVAFGKIVLSSNKPLWRAN